MAPTTRVPVPSLSLNSLGLQRPFLMAWHIENLPEMHWWGEGHRWDRISAWGWEVS